MSSAGPSAGVHCTARGAETPPPGCKGIYMEGLLLICTAFRLERECMASGGRRCCMQGELETEISLLQPTN